MDLLSLLNNLAKSAPSLIQMLLVLMGALGMVFGLRAGYDLYRHTCGENVPGMMSRNATLPVMMLSGALAVVPVILWRAANTFVAGGQKTYDMFAYLQQPSGSANYCDVTTSNMTLLFMALGLLSVFKAVTETYSRLTQPSQGGTYGGATIYFIGGILLFFINDVAAVLSNTTGMPIGLEQICAGFVA